MRFRTPALQRPGRPSGASRSRGGRPFSPKLRELPRVPCWLRSDPPRVRAAAIKPEKMRTMTVTLRAESNGKSGTARAGRRLRPRARQHRRRGRGRCPDAARGVSARSTSTSRGSIAIDGSGCRPSGETPRFGSTPKAAGRASSRAAILKQHGWSRSIGGTRRGTRWPWQAPSVLGRVGAAAAAVPSGRVRLPRPIGRCLPEGHRRATVGRLALPGLLQEIGADALLVTSAANLLIGVIIGFLGVSQLGRFGAVNASSSGGCALPRARSARDRDSRAGQCRAAWPRRSPRCRCRRKSILRPASSYPVSGWSAALAIVVPSSPDGDGLALRWPGGHDECLRT